METHGIWVPSQLPKGAVSPDLRSDTAEGFAKVYVPDEIKALPAEAPILKSRRLRDPDGELLLPLKTAKKGKAKKKAVGFNTPRTKK
eukprot:s3190_g9.t1